MVTFYPNSISCILNSTDTESTMIVYLAIPVVYRWIYDVGFRVVRLRHFPLSILAIPACTKNVGVFIYIY